LNSPNVRERTTVVFGLAEGLGSSSAMCKPVSESRSAGLSSRARRRTRQSRVPRRMSLWTCSCPPPPRTPLPVSQAV
jgi:hypothetical protein